MAACVMYGGSWVAWPGGFHPPLEAREGLPMVSFGPYAFDYVVMTSDRDPEIARADAALIDDPATLAVIHFVESWRPIRRSHALVNDAEVRHYHFRVRVRRGRGYVDTATDEERYWMMVTEYLRRTRTFRRDLPAAPTARQVRPIALGVAGNVLSGWAAVWTSAVALPWGVRALVARVRRAKGRCGRCGYDLRGGEAGRACPECGAAG